MWSRSAADPHPWEEDSWRLECKLKASDVSAVGDSKLPDVDSLPRLGDDEGEPRTILARLHSGHPTLSLLDDQGFYLMNKIDFRDKKAWVLAVDTVNKTLRAVAEFTADRIGGFSFTYRHTRLSEYLNLAPGPKGGLKRPLEHMLNIYAAPRTMQITFGGGQYQPGSAQVEGDDEMELE